MRREALCEWRRRRHREYAVIDRGSGVVQQPPLKIVYGIELKAVKSRRSIVRRLANSMKKVFTERQSEHLSRRAIDRKMHSCDRTVDRNAARLAHELLAPCDVLARFGGLEEVPEDIGDDECFRRVPAR